MWCVSARALVGVQVELLGQRRFLSSVLELLNSYFTHHLDQGQHVQAKTHSSGKKILKNLDNIQIPAGKKRTIIECTVIIFNNFWSETSLL